jgi:hypothetical protein
MDTDTHQTTIQTASDIRAELGRRRLRQYQLAALIRMDGGTLSAILSEQRPLTPEVLERIRAALVFESRAAVLKSR